MAVVQSTPALPPPRFTFENTSKNHPLIRPVPPQNNTMNICRGKSFEPYRKAKCVAIIGVYARAFGIFHIVLDVCTYILYNTYVCGDGEDLSGCVSGEMKMFLAYWTVSVWMEWMRNLIGAACDGEWRLETLRKIFIAC